MIDLAWHKSANQSSTWHQNHTADKAIDEDIFSCAEPVSSRTPGGEWTWEYRKSYLWSSLITDCRVTLEWKNFKSGLVSSENCEVKLWYH